MAFLGHMTTMSTGLSFINPAISLGQTQERHIWNSIACWNRAFSNSGEYNRYSKDHQEPISIDRVPVSIPSSVRAAKYVEYKQSPLTGDGDEIRLLELLPAVWAKSQDFIACRLVKRKLSENPQYEALSYTWGTLARNVPIFVVPSPLPEGLVVSDAILMTPQLYAAVKRLRLERTSRFLWVDQICIDQTNNKEKNEQVMIMDKVYAQSKRTIIWLGEEDEHRATFEEMIGFLTTEDADPKTDVDTIKKLFAADRPVVKRRQEAITHLLNRDYFTRAWIFQEAVLSRVLLVRCGGMEVPFNKFKRLIDAVMRVQYDSGGYARSLLMTTVGFDTVDLIQHGRTPCNDKECQRLLEADFLAVLFQALQQFRATNPRDLIYAFLAPRFQSLQQGNQILPDYDKAVEWVWTDAAHRIIADTRSLDILAAARGGQQGKFQLPSWVADWSYCFRYARPIAEPGLKTSFDACLGRPHILERSHENFMTLPVRGKIIRKIAWLAPLNFEIAYYRDGMDRFLNLDSHVTKFRQHLVTQRGIREEQLAKRWPDLKGEVLRTLLADGAFGTVQPLSEKTKNLERVLVDEKNIVETKQRVDAGEHVLNPRRWLGDYETLQKLWGWGLIAQRKVMFATKVTDGTDGPDTINLGLAASSVKLDDVIAVLNGSKVPLVLRPADEGRWTVISQCYLEGWMYNDGERDLFWKDEDSDRFILV